ncbi:hypothetical protein [Lake Baikal phage Baikal-20-5m-C28]|nr:hypothetical protein [Lake Baikal phage Baikal-20-5m-C28]
MDNKIKKNNNKAPEDWMQSRWRPAMGWMYMAVCVFDFIIFPILWAVVQFWENSVANDAFRQWSPLTLQGAGLFHMAMGAVLGVAAYGRTQEKVAGAASPIPGGNISGPGGNFGNDLSVNSASLNPAQPSPVSPEAALSASVPKVSPPRIPIV